jgi:hypothetical protein
LQKEKEEKEMLGTSMNTWDLSSPEKEIGNIPDKAGDSLIPDQEVEVNDEVVDDILSEEVEAISSLLEIEKEKPEDIKGECDMVEEEAVVDSVESSISFSTPIEETPSMDVVASPTFVSTPINETLVVASPTFVSTPINETLVVASPTIVSTPINETLGVASPTIVSTPINETLVVASPTSSSIKETPTKPIASPIRVSTPINETLGVASPTSSSPHPMNETPIRQVKKATSPTRPSQKRNLSECIELQNEVNVTPCKIISTAVTQPLITPTRPSQEKKQQSSPNKVVNEVEVQKPKVVKKKEEGLMNVLTANGVYPVHVRKLLREQELERFKFSRNLERQIQQIQQLFDKARSNTSVV